MDKEKFIKAYLVQGKVKHGCATLQTETEVNLYWAKIPVKQTFGRINKVSY